METQQGGGEEEEDQNIIPVPLATPCTHRNHSEKRKGRDERRCGYEQIKRIRDERCEVKRAGDLKWIEAQPTLRRAEELFYQSRVAREKEGLDYVEASAQCGEKYRAYVAEREEQQAEEAQLGPLKCQSPRSVVSLVGVPTVTVETVVVLLVLARFWMALQTQ